MAIRTYLGQTLINRTYIGSSVVNEKYLGNPIPVPFEGLVSLYNIAAGGYTANSITDLSGNGYDIALSGDVSYVAESSSFYFGSGSGVTSNMTELTGSDQTITIVQFWKYTKSNEQATWYVGGDTLVQNQQIYDLTEPGTNIPGSPLRVSATTGTTSSFADGWFDFQLLTAAATVDNYVKGMSNPPSNPPTWGYSGVSRDLGSTSSGSAEAKTNVKFFAKGALESSGNTWITSSVSSDYARVGQAAGQSTGTAPFVGVWYPDPPNIFPPSMSFNPTVSKLYVGKTPASSNDTGSFGYGDFYFGGMAIYDRVLTDAEYLQIYNYYDSFYPTAVGA